MGWILFLNNNSDKNNKYIIKFSSYKCGLKLI